MANMMKLRCYDGDIVEVSVEEMDAYLAEGVEAAQELELQDVLDQKEADAGIVTWRIEPSLLEAARQFRKFAAAKDYQAAWLCDFTW